MGGRTTDQLSTRAIPPPLKQETAYLIWYMGVSHRHGR
jgi:hypothetical protein